MRTARKSLKSAVVWAAALIVVLPWIAHADDKNPLLLHVRPSGVPGFELYIWRTHYPPGSATDPHRHNGDEAIYVLEGAIVSELGGKTMTLKAGQVVHVPEGTPMSTRNASAAEPGKTLVIMLARKGKPLHKHID